MTALITEETMKIRQRPNFGASLSTVGIRKSDLARAANLSNQTIQRLVKPENYRNNDKGNVSDVSAWRVARAYASFSGGTPEDAFNLLFVEVEGDEGDEE